MKTTSFACSILNVAQKMVFALTLSKATNVRLSNWKSLQATISNLIKMAESSPIEEKILWEKVKLLVMSNLSVSHSVFKWIVLQTRENQGLFGKGLKKITSIMGNGEDAVYQYFFIFPEYFCKNLKSWKQKWETFWIRYQISRAGYFWDREKSESATV